MSPILVDLSKSSWIKYNSYKITFIDALNYKKTKIKLFIGFFVMFTCFFNTRIAQLSLDEFTSAYYRGALMNFTSALANVSLIFIMAKIKI